MNLVWEPWNYKQWLYSLYFRLPWQWWNHFHEIKCWKIVNFEEMDTEWSTGKNYGFWVLWGIFKEYIKQNIIMAVLRKANSHSVVICRLTKKNQYWYCKKWSREKLTQTLVFLKLSSAHVVLIRGNVM